MPLKENVIVKQSVIQHMINRELSWLSFNERVLQEATDETVPLVERMRFLGIYSNNLDEFYRVRVANIKRMIHLQGKKIDGYNGTPSELYEEIQSVVIKQQKTFEATYKKITADLAAKGIDIINEKTATAEQKQELRSFFLKNIVHDIVPVMLDKKTTFPRIRDAAIYLGVKMEWDAKSKKRFALIEIPKKVARFYELKTGEHKAIILIDDIIRLNLSDIFPIFHFDGIQAYTFKFTRDAELNLDDDVSLSFIEKMEKSIKMRKKGNPVRVVYDQKMPKDLLESLSRCFKMDVNINAIPGGRYHNFKDFMKFPIFGHKEFLYETIQQQEHPVLKNQKSIIKQLLKQDVLLHFPYQKFDHVVDLIREAAIDPKVKSIKINIYRVAKESQVMNALINAMRNGKEVTVVLELQARFDEENNLYWAERLKEDGARVLYGFQELKIHSKLLQIRRVSEKSEQFITYIGTGNFNERTASIYTDFGLLTANRSLSLEVNNVFHMMEQTLHRHTFRFLTVSPINARRKLVTCINNEMKAAKKGDPSHIQIKINNLVDKHLIQKLYDASNAGVKIQLIIRGVCCLIPGIKGKSENIEIISIVDRFLEHTRMQIFHNNGEPLYFISSADWMERNMDQRIEVGTPIYDKTIQKELKSIFDIQWHDNVKARIIDKKQANNYKKTGDDAEQKRSQYKLMDRYKN